MAPAKGKEPAPAPAPEPEPEPAPAKAPAPAPAPEPEPEPAPPAVKGPKVRKLQPVEKRELHKHMMKLKDAGGMTARQRGKRKMKMIAKMRAGVTVESAHASITGAS